ncbi:hypothetical protein [Abyssisolibacter fermentans]|uniref:hypothetical protein n=1 Tax=Abyssisolibacter fermentans TaxID=1766203 RepID=UPI0012E34E59|nr:hypothetical protein [Abyssisolibacter fermentans]
MIYEMMRFIAGPYLNAAVDYYTAHQSIFNIIVVTLGFIWIYFNKHYKQVVEKK